MSLVGVVVVMLLSHAHSNAHALPAASSSTPTDSSPRPHPADSSGTGSRGQSFSQAHFQFTLDLYLALVNRSSTGTPTSSPSDNLLFSPVGVAALLYPLLHARDALVSSQIKQVLGYSNMSDSQLQEDHSAMMARLSDTYFEASLRLAYVLYLQEGSVSGQVLHALYPTSVTEQVDFNANATEVLRSLNQWAWRNQSPESTTGTPTSPPLVTPTPLQTPTPDALALLLVYFSGRWFHRFERNLTFDKGLFYITSQERFEIPMMVGRMELPLGYSAQLEVRILELPYTARRLSMFLLLPDHLDHGLANLEANISSHNIKALLSTLKEERVNLRLPRFRVTSQPPLKEALISLGLTDVFSSSFSSSESQPGGGPYLRHLLHRSVCEVVEEGEDPSPTLASKGDQVGTFGDKYFEVDHPFVFFLWDYLASSVVLMGRVVTPEPILLPPTP